MTVDIQITNAVANNMENPDNPPPNPPPNSVGETRLLFEETGWARKETEEIKKVN